MELSIPQPFSIFNMGGLTGAGGKDCFGNLVVSIEFSKHAANYVGKFRPRYRVLHEVIRIKQDDEFEREDHEQLADKIFRCASYQIMILQGINALIDTHQFLSDHGKIRDAITRHEKRIAIVVAQHPICVEDSDLPWSLAAASTWLMYCNPGIYAVAHGDVFHCDEYKQEPDGCIRRR